MKPSPSDFCWSRDCVEWSHDHFTTSLSFGQKLAKSGQKWPKRSLNDQNWPESLKNDIRNHLHWISAPLAVILSGHMTSLRQFLVKGQNWSKMAKKRPQMTKIGLKVWKVTSETISIGLLLLLRSFWVVTWLVCDNFKFRPKTGPKQLRKVPKWPQKARK